MDEINRIELNRIEYKCGWNPTTICQNENL